MRSDFTRNQRIILGDRLRQCREASIYETPEEFGQAFGATAKQVLAWERGESEPPFSVGVAIAHVCHVSECWLLDSIEPDETRIKRSDRQPILRVVAR
jgi:transcriptional regulator with XRE-family HTH domain